MPSQADIIVGLQWGDEGKGRIVDLYAAEYDVVARFAGGDNAGHSIVVGDRELALRIVPSGVMHPHVELFVGGGTVVNLDTLIGELDALAEMGIDTSRVKISDRAHVVFPHHVERD
ncbi:MAG: adenylosuccinate synthetase, partial [Candidatus Eremiobacteraeota bacterium]|nr:adenylosuccinate synthetase [Candidatus Eremiobacteraeota bacterium]